jgi:hypothetical protein
MGEGLNRLLMCFASSKHKATMGTVIQAKSVFETVARGEELTDVVVYLGDIGFWAGERLVLKARKLPEIISLITNDNCGLDRVTCHSVC